MMRNFIGGSSFVAGRLVGKSDITTKSRHKIDMIGADCPMNAELNFG
jgi:hypothetical protein